MVGRGVYYTMNIVSLRGAHSSIMEQGSVDRRRGRRARVQASLLVRRGATPGTTSVREEVTSNISLAGVYFETEHGDQYTMNEMVTASVAVPDQQTRQFPFRRLSGRTRVVRVNELPSGTPSGRRRFGVALEFGDDVTALTAIPSPG